MFNNLFSYFDIDDAYNKRSHNRPLRGLDLNRCAGFGLCCERYMAR
uniref:Uncharacterized protein n=1 Tax=Rheinheimera sp. BAL341 TaxID=1708203 RepID=A0A486XGT3_9GAMM